MHSEPQHAAHEAPKLAAVHMARSLQKAVSTRLLRRVETSSPPWRVRISLTLARADLIKLKMARCLVSEKCCAATNRVMRRLAGHGLLLHLRSTYEVAEGQQ